jgi:hypothetical protein
MSDRTPDALVTLKRDFLDFRFPGVHPRAKVSISFQRTLRVPDDGRKYPLPAGFGRFPLRHVEDYADRLPDRILSKGGILLPLYQAEALWIHFNADWPSAIQVGTGKICAITGESWRGDLVRHPEQNYLIAPHQPWLDGYAMEKGQVRQFVAMPLGRGLTVEEQKTGTARWNGIQLQAFPLRRDQWEKEQAEARSMLASSASLHGDAMEFEDADPSYSVRESAQSMGIAPGGLIEQDIYADGRPLGHWDQLHPARVFVHLLNSHDWQRVTGELPPESPITIETYRRHGVPWFDHYRDDIEALPPGEGFKGVRSTGELGATTDPQEEGTPADPPVTDPIVHTGPRQRPRRVHSADF